MLTAADEPTREPSVLDLAKRLCSNAERYVEPSQAGAPPAIVDPNVELISRAASEWLRTISPPAPAPAPYIIGALAEERGEIGDDPPDELRTPLPGAPAGGDPTNLGAARRKVASWAHPQTPEAEAQFQTDINALIVAAALRGAPAGAAGAAPRGWPKRMEYRVDQAPSYRGYVNGWNECLSDCERALRASPPGGATAPVHATAVQS